MRFWRQAGEDKWFGGGPDFDRDFRARFFDLHMAVAARRHDDWIASPEGALALILLTDQFPRNAFRDTPHMYATDCLARHYARQAMEAGHAAQTELELRKFFALPFTHSEDAIDQDLSCTLFGPLGAEELGYAEGHRDIIRRFGRFPHRNAILARAMTGEEEAFLAEGGFKG